MHGHKIEQFLKLAGNEIPSSFEPGSIEKRKLGAQLLLSEILEYVIKGLGITPVFKGTEITEPDGLEYRSKTSTPDHREMLDGLADVAYTMYWNSIAFGLPLEEAFELVCDNNLEKFVKLENWHDSIGPLPQSEWHCGCNTMWPKEVTQVEVIKLENDFYAVGKDERGKVRKPSHYEPVDLTPLCSNF